MERESNENSKAVDEKEVPDDSYWSEKLETLMTNFNGKYFNFTNVTTRHECWFMASAISNYLLCKEIKALREQISSTTKQVIGRRKDLL